MDKPPIIASAQTGRRRFSTAEERFRGKPGKLSPPHSAVRSRWIYRGTRACACAKASWPFSLAQPEECDVPAGEGRGRGYRDAGTGGDSGLRDQPPETAADCSGRRALSGAGRQLFCRAAGDRGAEKQLRLAPSSPEGPLSHTLKRLAALLAFDRILQRICGW